MKIEDKRSTPLILKLLLIYIKIVARSTEKIFSSEVMTKVNFESLEFYVEFADMMSRSRNFLGDLMDFTAHLTTLDSVKLKLA